MRLTQTRVQNRIMTSQLAFSESVKISLHDNSSIRRKELENCIAAKFLSVYQAKLSRFLPILLALDNINADDKETLAVTGLNPASKYSLFLENYIDTPIEQAIAAVVHQPVIRETVIEIGNLAVTRRGVGLLQFLMMTAILSRADFRWVVFTATQEVEKQLEALGFTLTYLADADPSRLGKGADRWGNYYESQPKLMVGSIEHGMGVINDSPLLKQAYLSMDDEIQTLCLQLKAFSSR